MRRIDLETGHMNNRFSFHLVKDENITMGNKASFPVTQWSLFLDQISDAFKPGIFDGIFNNNYRIRNLTNYPLPPLGSKEMQHVIRNSVVSTPAYQLFLAAIDLTDAFLFEQDDKKYKAKCLVSTGRVNKASS